MSSPFQQLISEFERVDGRAWEQFAAVILLAGVALLCAAFIVHRRNRRLGFLRSISHSMWLGISFPALALTFVWLASVAAKAWTSGMVFKLALPIFGSLAAIRVVARVLRNLFPKSGAARTLINLTSVLVWVGVVLHFVGALPLLTSELEQVIIPIGKARVDLLALLQGLVLIAVTLLGALWLSALIETRIAAFDVAINTRLLISRLLRAFLLVLALLLSLSAVGIDLTVLSVFGGALGVGLGLGLQRIAANYVSGFAMLVEGSFRVGDYVRLDAFEGIITQINSRYTVVRATNGREAVIPNETFMTQRVEHSSLSDTKVSVVSTLLIDYGSDVNHVIPLVMDAIRKEARVLNEPPPAVFVSNFAADGIELTMSFWIADPQNGQLALRSDINRSILSAFSANGVGMPFPQRTVKVISEPASRGDTVEAVAKAT
ncbi:MAG: mechanosensitive ion channel protein [Burkholderiales bacterium]|nr:MAG: mechanosensitive ion channel protein [Burkholderiales bacterium]TAG81467.1 MAG: mechanosensitive ion channel protein [Betaproteobacteria bacterium]